MAIIDIINAPFTFLAIRISIRSSPNTLSCTELSLKFPKNIPVSVATIIPELFNPINAIKSPTPAVIAVFIFSGSPSSTILLTEEAVTSTSTTPEMVTAASPCCHVYPILPTTVETKNTVSPSPGAVATGSFENNACIRVPSIAIRHTAVYNPPSGIPASLKNPGITASTYAIVRNVVIPAIISVFISVPFFESS